MFTGGAMEAKGLGSISLRSLNETVAPPPSNALDDLQKRVERLISEAGSVAATLEVTADRVFGGETQAAPTPDNGKVPFPGALGVVFSRLDELERAIAYCQRKANRLAQL